jgi:hypothetical protein
MVKGCEHLRYLTIKAFSQVLAGLSATLFGQQGSPEGFLSRGLLKAKVSS